MSKILVTGATGFLGKRLVPALVLEGHEVRCAVSRKVDGLAAPQVVVKKLECDPDWSEALSGVDIVIHLAARVHVMKEQSKSASEDYFKINSDATKNFAQQAVKHQIKRFIFLSSIKVNGELTAEGFPFTEESAAQPKDDYGLSKLYAEQYLQEIGQNSAMQVVIIRPPLIYGPGVKANFLKMLHTVRKGVVLPFARVQNKRHLIYIENLVSALCTVATHPLAGNQAYLVADDEALSLPQLISRIAQEMNVTTKLIPIPVRFMARIFQWIGLKNLNTRLFGSLEVSNAKIKSQLGWIPPFSTTEGLRATVAWFLGE